MSNGADGTEGALATVDESNEVALVPDGHVFDVDGAQYAGGDPCSVCGIHQVTWRKPRAFVRIRKKVDGGTRQVALLCPDCIARALIQVERCGLWSEMSPAVQAAITRTLANKRRVAVRRKP